MNISFSNVKCDKLKHALQLAIEHYGETLGIRSDLRRNLIIDIEFSDDCAGEDVGFCYWEDRRIKPRQFTIELDSKRQPEEMLQDLAHEMVHVKQWARGDLVDLKDGKHLWKGEHVKLTGDKWKDYWFCPWELEARAWERPMYLKFMEDFDPEKEITTMKKNANG